MKHIKKFNESTSDISISLMELVEEIETEYVRVRSDVSHHGRKSIWFIEFDGYSKEERNEIIHKISVGLEEINEDYGSMIEIDYFMEDWKWIKGSIKSIKDLIRLRISDKSVTKLNIILLYEN